MDNHKISCNVANCTICGNQTMKGHYTISGENVPPCPRCSKLTVEGLAKVLMKSLFNGYDDWEDAYTNLPMEADNYRIVAQAIMNYLEGK